MCNPRSQSFSSLSSVSVCTGENDTKTLVCMKIFCFLFAAKKTDAFEKALVWMGPKSFKFSKELGLIFIEEVLISTQETREVQ